MADTSKALLNTFTVTPDQSGYSHAFGDDTIDAKFGSVGNYRRGFFNNAMPFDVSWIASACEYNYIQAAYRAFINSGGVPFLIDLVADQYRLTQHKAIFEKGSLRLTKIQEETYFLSAQLWAEPDVQYDVATRPFVTDQSLSDLRLVAGVGIFNTTGRSVTLRLTSRSFSAGSASFVVSGQTATLGRPPLVAGTGMFAVTGETVELDAP